MNLRSSVVALAGVIGIGAGAFLFWLNDKPAEAPEHLSIASLNDQPVVVLESVIVQPGEKADRPFIEGQGKDEQGGVEEIAILVDGAIRCGASIAWADHRANHFEFALTPSQKSNFYDPSWSFTDFKLVKCIRDTTVIQFRAGVAANSDIEALVEADPSPFASLTVEKAADWQGHSDKKNSSAQGS